MILVTILDYYSSLIPRLYACEGDHKPGDEARNRVLFYSHWLRVLGTVTSTKECLKKPQMYLTIHEYNYQNQLPYPRAKLMSTCSLAVVCQERVQRLARSQRRLWQSVGGHALLPEVSTNHNQNKYSDIV